jgi:hypothetical protein
MEDKEAIEILKSILTKYPLDEREREGVREAIGLLAWTKLVEGYNDRRKKARDKKLAEPDNPYFN